MEIRGVVELTSGCIYKSRVLITESNTPYSIFENFLQDYSNFDALLQSIIDNNFEKYKVLNYNPYPFIKAEVAV